ncbi:MAG: adenine phosphoribosyltransferase [Streptosporangiaceae bacterium]
MTTVGVGQDIELAAALRAGIRVVPDFPRPGIDFQDLCPIFAQPGLMRLLTCSICAAYDDSYNKVLAVEARGFVLGANVAAAEEKPLVLARKKGKLPGATHRTTYTLEYGSEVLEIQVGAIRPGDRVLVVDDVLATGGTLAAASQLIALGDGVTAGHAVAVVIEGLNGQSRLAPAPVYAALSVG